MSPITISGDGSQPQYLTFDTDTKCTVVDYQTEFSIYNRDDYKRCVCTYFGLGEPDCPHEQPKCQWTDGKLNDNKKEILVETEVPIEIEAYQIADELMDFSECVDSNGDAIEDVETFQFMELVRDNNG